MTRGVFHRYLPTNSRKYLTKIIIKKFRKYRYESDVSRVLNGVIILHRVHVLRNNVSGFKQKLDFILHVLIASKQANSN